MSDENGSDPPDSLDWIPSGTSRNYDPAPEPSDMLDWEADVLPMIEAARNSRDAAAIALQFDAGLRGWEFKDVAVGDVTDHKHGLQVTADGKQETWGDRSLIEAWFGVLKYRTMLFRHRFPHYSTRESTENWLTAFATLHDALLQR